MQDQQKKGWWSRNWKWCLPVAFVGSLAVMAGVLVAFLMAISGMMKSSSVYKQAFETAKNHSMVQQHFGNPIKDSMFFSGNINISGTSGNADISIPISGPEGDGIVHVIAVKTSGQWTFSALVVEVSKTGESIDLLAHRNVLDDVHSQIQAANNH